MPSVFRQLHGFTHYVLAPSKRADYKNYKIITGRRPCNLALYERATRHASAADLNPRGIRDSYERLEYLGDAILGMVVAEALFKRFPFKEEGFLTELRSKVVNRESLNHLSLKIGLNDLVKFQRTRGVSVSHKSIYGDCLEALVGAIYIDQGFRFTKSFILHKLIEPHFDFEELARTTTNYKSKIIEWAQKEGKIIQFDMVKSNEDSRNKQFVSQVVIDNKQYGKGSAYNKKKAEQEAAQRTLEMLNIE